MNTKPLAPKVMLESGNDAAVTSSTSSSNRVLTSRKRIAFHPTLGYAIPPPVPAKVARRNARERNRVKQVNCGFEMLRTHIPSAAKQKKMSKVETLRHAVEYIQTLQKMLHHQHQQHHSAAPLTPSRTPCSSTTPMNFALPLPEAQTTVTPHVSHFPPSTPLTPRTPTTAPDFPVYSHHQTHNDSGYDTSSFYSGTSPPDMMNYGLQGRPYGETQLHSMSSQYHGDGYYAHELQTQPEEDELLDAIVKWQEQED